jgi:hypothetical protein
VSMNKDEILAKSRKENQSGDERAKYIEGRGAVYSSAIMILLWVLLTRLTPLDEAARYTTGLLVMATCFANYAYQLAMNRTKTNILFLALYLTGTLLYLAGFLRFALGLF